MTMFRVVFVGLILLVVSVGRVPKGWRQTPRGGWILTDPYYPGRDIFPD